MIKNDEDDDGSLLDTNDVKIDDEPEYKKLLQHTEPVNPLSTLPPPSKDLAPTNFK